MTWVHAQKFTWYLRSKLVRSSALSQSLMTTSVGSSMIRGKRYFKRATRRSLPRLVANSPGLIGQKKNGLIKLAPIQIRLESKLLERNDFVSRPPEEENGPGVFDDLLGHR